MGKRQVEQLAVAAAADVDAYYAAHRPAASPGDVLLVMQFDGKGIVMRPEALREATAKAARAARRSWPPGCPRGRRTAASGWPSSAASMTACPCPAPPRTSSPGPARTPGSPRPRPPRSYREVADRLGHRRHPRRHRRRVRRGARRDPDQSAPGSPWWTATSSRSRRSRPRPASAACQVTILIDFIHVLEYCWKAAWSFFEPGDPDAEHWVAAQATKILEGKAGQVAAGIRRRATTYGYAGKERDGADDCADYLTAKRPYLGLRHRARQRLADRYRRHRGRLPPHRQRPNGHHRRQMGTGRRRSHPQTPRPAQQRRLRTLLDLAPGPRTTTHSLLSLQRPRRPRRMIKCPLSYQIRYLQRNCTLPRTEKPLRYDRMSGLDSEQLDELVWRIEDQLEGPWHKGIGRPKDLTLREAVSWGCIFLRGRLFRVVSVMRRG